MRSFKTLPLLLAASIAISFASAAEQTSHSLSSVPPRRHLRVQHGGADDHEVASEAGIPGYVKAAPLLVVPSPVTSAAVSAPATVSAPTSAAASGNPVGISAPATPPPQSQYQIPTAPASPTTDVNPNTMPSSVSTDVNVNAKPSSVNTNINIAPAKHTTTVIGVPAPAPAPAPASQTVPQVLPQSQPQPRPQPVSPPAPVSKPSTSGLGFGDLNPLSAVATLAHTAHGALLGHTGTVPSSYMQGKSGGGGGHGH